MERTRALWCKWLLIMKLDGNCFPWLTLLSLVTLDWASLNHFNGENKLLSRMMNNFPGIFNQCCCTMWVFSCWYSVFSHRMVQGKVEVNTKEDRWKLSKLNALGRETEILTQMYNFCVDNKINVKIGKWTWNEFCGIASAWRWMEMSDA